MIHQDTITSVPEWVQADPSYIAKALQHSQSLPASGWPQGWYVACGSRSVLPGCPTGLVIAGQELVVWRDAGGAVQVAPGACPHMGARLCDGAVHDGQIVCPWHGLALGPNGHRGWKPYTVHDDGTLVWVQLEGSAPQPLFSRPTTPYISSVIRVEVGCDPIDIIANRLDPWHAAPFHPHAFGQLRVLEKTIEKILVRVTYLVLGRIGVTVDATFHTPSPYCILMTIISGQGEGSLVETHATPIGPGRTAVVEATFATSPRAGFRHALKLARWIRPLLAKRAQRLWIEDAAYAERRYALRTQARHTP